MITPYLDSNTATALIHNNILSIIINSNRTQSKSRLTKAEMIQNNSEGFLVVNFLTVEERPLIGGYKTGILTLFLLLNLLLGLLIQSRVFFMLQYQGKDGSSIDRLFKSHNYVTMTCQPLLIIYIIFSHHVYPMIDYIGLPGCLFFSQFLNVFSAIYYLVFPLTIAVVR